MLHSLALNTAAATLPVGVVMYADTALAAPAERAIVQPDAELLRLGAEFDRLYAEWLPVLAEWQRLDDLREEAFKNIAEPKGMDEFSATWDATGCGAANEANGALLARVDAVADAIRAIPATTLAGLYVKARVVKHNSFCPWQFTDDPNDMDWDVFCFDNFLSEVARVAGSPDAGAVPVSAASSLQAISAPDLELIALGKQLEEADAKLKAIDAFKDPAVEEAYDAVSRIVHRIEAAPAKTLDGFRVKARAIAWCQCEEAIDLDYAEYGTTDLRIANSLIRDLLA